MELNSFKIISTVVCLPQSVLAEFIQHYQFVLCNFSVTSFYFSYCVFHSLLISHGNDSRSYAVQKLSLPYLRCCWVKKQGSFSPCSSFQLSDYSPPLPPQTSSASYIIYLHYLLCLQLLSSVESWIHCHSLQHYS